MKRNTKLTSGFVALIFILLIAAQAGASTFDPNLIITDEEMLNSKSMTLGEIDQFLKARGGYISRNVFTDAFGKSRSAAEIIYNAANNHDCETNEQNINLSREEKDRLCKPATINPKVLIVLLQKEQSLIEETSPSQKALDWATGYAVCDNCSMSDPTIQRFKGFGKQVNSASLQFYDYMSNPQNYSYKAGGTYTVANTNKPSMIVQPKTQATAALYNYTPHVYNGNFNFFKLYNRFFSLVYPNNTLLQIKGEGGIWLIQNGKRRPFLSKGALTSRYDLNKVIQVSPSVLNQYPSGAPIKFPQYSLLRSPRGTVFLLVDDIKRGFSSAEALRKIGYNPEEIINASWDDINAYQDGPHLTATSSYPTGALLQDKSSGGIFYVTDGTKAPLWDKVLLKTKFKRKSITVVSSDKLASFTTVEPAIFGDGELLKTSNSAGVYVIDNKKKRVIISGEIFESLGYKWENVIDVPAKIMNLYPDGEPITSVYGDEEVIDLGVSTSTDSLITTTTEAAAPKTKGLFDLLSEKNQEELNDILNPGN
jgi:hypothetical protein